MPIPLDEFAATYMIAGQAAAAERVRERASAEMDLLNQIAAKLDTQGFD